MRLSPHFFGIGFALTIVVGCAGHTTEAPPPAKLDPQDACASICNRADAMCGPGLAGPSCTSDCVKMRVDGSPCNPLWDTFLACALDAPLDCTDGIKGCDDQERAYRQCPGNADPGSPQPTPNPGGACSSIPPMVGGGSCGGSAGSGQSCSASCEDRTGNVWEAVCSGSSCQCSYNHEFRCSCATSGTSGCSSCCPGT
jgi:hypothetical protein